MALEHFPMKSMSEVVIVKSIKLVETGLNRFETRFKPNPALVNCAHQST